MELQQLPGRRYEAQKRRGGFGVKGCEAESCKKERIGLPFCLVRPKEGEVEGKVDQLGFCIDKQSV